MNAGEDPTALAFDDAAVLIEKIGNVGFDVAVLMTDDHHFQAFKYFYRPIFSK
jgi:hypothetical protein